MATIFVSGSTLQEPARDRMTLVFNAQTSDPDVPVELPYLIRGGNAHLLSDFLAFNTSPIAGVAGLGDGDLVAPVTTAVGNDTLLEVDESVVLDVWRPPDGILAGEPSLIGTQAVSWIIDEDALAQNLSPLPSLFVTSPVIEEGGPGVRRPVAFELELSKPFSTDVTFDYRLGGSATPGVDYEGAGGTFTIAAGDTRASIPLTILGDGAREGLEDITLDIDWFYLMFNQEGGRATIVDDDAPGPFVMVSGSAIGEPERDRATVPFVVRLTAPSDEPVEVPYRIVGGTASQGSDFIAFDTSPLTGTVTFAPGEVQKVLTTSVASDSVREDDETILLLVGEPDDAALPGGARSAVAASWIIENALAGNVTYRPFVASTGIVEGDEGTRTMSFRIELPRPAGGDVTFAYATRDGTATAGEDYVPASGTVTIENGARVATVGVEVIGDVLGLGARGRPADIGDETFDLVLTSQAFRVLGGSATGTIVNDDPRVLNGSDAGETLVAEAGGQLVRGFGGNDLLRAVGEGDFLDGGGGWDTLEGGPGRDTLVGGRGDDSLRAGPGDDRLAGDGGSDTLGGGAGRDILRGGPGRDHLIGGPGSDTVAYDGSSRVSVDLAGQKGRGGDAAGDRFEGIENVRGSSAGDALWGDEAANVIQALGGNDIVRSGDGADTIEGNTGDDRIDGGGGADAIDGGAGWDTVLFDRSDAGVDVRLVEGTGAGGDAQGDTFESVEHAVGSLFDDAITGSSGTNIMQGLAGRDVLVGRGGDDFLYGQAGRDRLVGGDGDDRMKGGQGADAYVFDLDDGFDVIRGFQRSIDRIELPSSVGFEDLAITSRSWGTRIDVGETTIALAAVTGALTGEQFIFA